MGEVKIGMMEVREERPEAREQWDMILKDIRSTKQNYIRLGEHLCRWKEKEYFRDFGYLTFDGFCDANVPLDAGTISRCMAVYREFCAVPDAEKYKDYSYSQLTEMLPLDTEQRKGIRPEMTIRQIREYKQELKEAKRKEELRERRALEYRDPYIHDDEKEEEEQQYEPLGESICARDRAVMCHIEENRVDGCDAVCCAICSKKMTCNSVCETAKKQSELKQDLTNEKNVINVTCEGTYPQYSSNMVKNGTENRLNQDLTSEKNVINVTCEVDFCTKNGKMEEKTSESIENTTCEGTYPHRFSEPESWAGKREKLEYAAHMIAVTCENGQKEELERWMSELQAAVQELEEKAKRENRNFL